MTALYYAFAAGLTLGAIITLVVMSLFIVGRLGEGDIHTTPPHQQRYQD